MNALTIQTYHARLQRVLQHIEAHLDDALDVETLSGVAAFSRHHFHRQFTALFGIGVYRYIKLCRLKRASYQLAFRDDPILTIALDAGYEGPEAFARAFKQRVGQTPTDFRTQPDWSPWHDLFQPVTAIRTTHMKRDWSGAAVEIVETKDIRAAVLEHHGDPARIGDSIRRFIAWRKSVGLRPVISATFNVFYGDPDTTPPEDFRLDICAATDRDVADRDAGIVMKTIPGGRCARLRYVGSDDGFGEAAAYLYGVWLPASGEDPRDFPFYCQRVKFFPDVPEHEAVTDLFLPLK